MFLWHLGISSVVHFAVFNLDFGTHEVLGQTVVQN